MSSLARRMRAANLALVRASDGHFRLVHRITGVTVGGDVSTSRVLAAMPELRQSVTPLARDLRAYGVVVWVTNVEGN